jgi:hypothetical protein
VRRFLPIAAWRSSDRESKGCRRFHWGWENLLTTGCA